MAREAQWWQFAWRLEFNDNNLHSQEIGAGVLDQPGITVVRIIGRVGYWYINRTPQPRGNLLFAGVLMTGGQVDPIDQANGMISGQRWKWWSSLLAITDGRNADVGQDGTAGYDRTEFDVRGMMKRLPNEEWRLCWKLNEPVVAGQDQVFMGAMRFCYLLP